MTLTCDLDLVSRKLGHVAMCSAHRLTERNIEVKFNENRPKCSEDMERTQNARVNHLTLTCDLDLESR